MRSILLHANNDANFAARLQVALDIARAFDAHLTLLQAVSYDFTMPGDFYGATVADMLPIARAAADAFRAEVEPRLNAEDVRWDWVEELGLADSRMLQHGALADLAIIGASAPGGQRGPSPLAGILAIHGKTPIMVVPDTATGMTVDGPAVVCWNGSLEAARALRAALPLLEKAASVHLLNVREGGNGDEQDDVPPLTGAEYLARHGVACEVVQMERGSARVDALLKEAAAARGATLMVMGAYGHARLIETLFGGVTRSMLSAPELPILLAH